MRFEYLWRGTLPLIVVAATIGLLLAGVDAMTRERIADNEHRRTRELLVEMMGLPSGAAERLAGSALGERLPPRFALCVPHAQGVERHDFASGSAAGYGGRIRFLASAHDGRLHAVRIVAHQETPGLGDLIEPRRSDWLMQLIGLDLAVSADWRLRNDGGTIDAISGATITSRGMTAGLAGAAAMLQETEGLACEYLHAY
jgi:Na+-translocating ferredoxin:NAD+ oxidoreductase subunit G